MAEREFDVVIVGGGIFGVCAAWEAAHRGLSTALVERADFGGATSANCFKMVHGGIRYLQHGDLARLWESSRERSIFLRIAPHLVHPLPIVVPTYRNAGQGKSLLRAGCAAYDLLTLRRNRSIQDPHRRIPPAYSISPGECLAKFPHLRRDGLTGAVVFHDAQMYSPPRLALAFLRSAVEHGAEAANYMEVQGFVRRGEQIVGVRARDLVDNNRLEIRGRVIVNAAGPWAPWLLRELLRRPLRPPLCFSRDASFIVRRRVNEEYALAIPGRTSDPDAIVSRSRRHLFLAPWRDFTLVGVWHVVHQKGPDDFRLTPAELARFLDEVNESCPELDLKLDEVSNCHAGLVLFGDNRPGATNLRYGKRSRIVDHRIEHGLDGLISLVGVRFTTARAEARRVVNLVGRKLGKKLPPSKSDVSPVFGGQIEHFSDFVQNEMRQIPQNVDGPVMMSLLRNHGARYRDVLALAGERKCYWSRLSGSNVIKAEVVHAIRQEMAQRLSDVVLRRTDLGTAENPGKQALAECADLMAAELRWDERRKKRELENQIRQVGWR